MSELVINTNESQAINFAPKNLFEEVAQNVKTLINTPVNSVPLDRVFGIDSSIVDLPETKACAKIKNEIIQAITKFEPRVRVQTVEFMHTHDNGLNCRIKIKIP